MTRPLCLLPMAVLLLNSQHLTHFTGVLADTTYAYAVDVYTAISQSNFQCMYNNGYSVAFVRVYTPYGGGSPDSNGASNIVNALAASLGVEVFVQPSPQSVKSGAQQYNETYAYLANSSIVANQMWLLVTQPMIWSLDPDANNRFINSFIARAQQNGTTVGIYTNWYDWYLITNQYLGVSSSSVMLWYWHTLGIGSGAETTQDFGDYRQLGNWATATVKQFGIGETLCSSTVNRDVYVASSSASAKKALVERADLNKRLALRKLGTPRAGHALLAKGASDEGGVLTVGVHQFTQKEGAAVNASDVHRFDVPQWARPPN